MYPGRQRGDALLADKAVLAFIREKAAKARFVNALDFLPAFGAIPCSERVVQDGFLITAGGVTSGIDFGLTVVAELLGR